MVLPIVLSILGVVGAPALLMLWEDLWARHLVRNDLRLRRCRPLRLRRRWAEQGLLIKMSWSWEEGPETRSGFVYAVDYLDPDAAPKRAVGMTGPGGLVLWTDEFPEPGLDRFGRPRDLPTYGQNWRG